MKNIFNFLKEKWGFGIGFLGLFCIILFMGSTSSLKNNEFVPLIIVSINILFYSYLFYNDYKKFKK